MNERDELKAAIEQYAAACDEIEAVKKEYDELLRQAIANRTTWHAELVRVIKALGKTGRSIIYRGNSYFYDTEKGLLYITAIDAEILE